MKTFWNDFSLSALIAGFVTVLVGFTSSALIVFQGAAAAGANADEIASWMWALGMGIGLTSIVLSLRYRKPVLTAWSTPGAAILIAGASGFSLNEAIGAFLMSAALVAISGFSGWFERALNRIPLSLASAMLAGILVRFGLDVFVAMKTRFFLAFTMLCVYLLARRFQPRYAVLLALAAGVAIAATQGLLRTQSLHWALARPIWTTPHFSLASLVGIVLPLFVVTMASQNAPGVVIMRALKNDAPVSPIIGWTGITTLVLAPFGAFALNLSAFTAAICMGPQAHEDPARRYVAAVMAGVFYIGLGLLGATVTAVFTALPQELTAAIAGLALFGTIAQGLANAFEHDHEREPALITFLVTASGLTLWGVGAAFWGLLAGVLAVLILRATPDRIKQTLGFSSRKR